MNPSENNLYANFANRDNFQNKSNLRSPQPLKGSRRRALALSDLKDRFNENIMSNQETIP